MKQVQERPSDPACQASAGPKPRWWFRAPCGGGFTHRRTDIVRSAAGLAVLVVCALLVRGHALGSMESSVLLFVNGWPAWLYRPMWLLQLAGVIVVGPIAAAVAALLRRFRLAVALLLATGLKIWLESVVKIVVKRQRPGVLEPSVILRGNVAHQGLSFVSGHAILVLVLAALISPYLRGRWKAVPWTIAGLNLLARLYLGAHFPLGLIGGAGLGLFIGAGLNFAMGVPASRMTLAPEAEPAHRRPTNEDPGIPETTAVVATAASTSAARKRPNRVNHVVRGLISVVVVVAIFGLILPKIVSYSSVLKDLSKLSLFQMLAVTGAMVFNLVTYWWQMQAAMPGLSLWQAAVNNQTGTTISNIVPGGGVIAIGLVVEMFRSWGFTGSEIALELSTTGIWNSFMKLALPIVALALLAITGGATALLLIPAVIGLVALAGAILVFALLLRKKQFARAIGNAVGSAWSRIRRLMRKPPVTSWGDAAVKFRKETIRLIVRRWIPLTLATVISHLALFFVLLLSLRFLGINGQQVTWAQVLAVFSIARLASALPFTPGGLGVVELALIGGLYAAGRHHAGVPLKDFKASVTAATFLFRTLTYGIQIPLGGFTYMIWRRNRRWRREPPSELPVPMQPVPGEAEPTPP